VSEKDLFARQTVFRGSLMAVCALVAACAHPAAGPVSGLPGIEGAGSTPFRVRPGENIDPTIPLPEVVWALEVEGREIYARWTITNATNEVIRILGRVEGEAGPSIWIDPGENRAMFALLRTPITVLAPGQSVSGGSRVPDRFESGTLFSLWFTAVRDGRQNDFESDRRPLPE